MEYPQNLLELFDDPLLTDVKPMPIPLTVDDRLKEKLFAVNHYVRKTGRIPSSNGTFEEKRMYRSLVALRTHEAVAGLKEWDEYHLLDIKSESDG